LHAPLPFFARHRLLSPAMAGWQSIENSKYAKFYSLQMSRDKAPALALAPGSQAKARQKMLTDENCTNGHEQSVVSGWPQFGSKWKWNSPRTIL